MNQTTMDFNESSASALPPPSDFTQDVSRTGGPPGNQAAEATLNEREALLAKRRARPQKVCRPCRLRKVKCSYELPCQTCIERGHPELCQYMADPPAKRVAVESSLARGEDSEQFAPSREEWDTLQTRLANIESMLMEIKERPVHAPQNRRSDQSRSNETDEEGSVSETQGNPAILARRAFSSNAVYLGGNSVPAMVTALATEQHSDIEVQTSSRSPSTSPASSSRTR